MGNALFDSGVIISYGSSIYDEAKMRLGNKLRSYRTEEFNTSPAASCLDNKQLSVGPALALPSKILI